MESILELSESRGARYPDHFEEFLNNCLEKYEGKFLANDYLFAAVYFIILECGYCPIKLNYNNDNSSSISFDIRKLRFIKSYNDDHMKLMKNDIGEYWVYGVQLKLGNYRCKCELQGVPSVENNIYLIINFLSKHLGIVKSLCLSTENYTEKNDSLSNHIIKLKNLSELSLLLKNKLANSIKEAIMLSEGQGCCPHLLRLPEDIQKKIVHYLVEDSTDVQYLASSCSYFYNIIANDFKLWEIMCITDFDGKLLNEALHELLQTSNNAEDKNIFRKVFLLLKKQSLKRGYRYLY